MKRPLSVICVSVNIMNALFIATHVNGCTAYFIIMRPTKNRLLWSQQRLNRLDCWGLFLSRCLNITFEGVFFSTSEV